MQLRYFDEFCLHLADFIEFLSAFSECGTMPRFLRSLSRVSASREDASGSAPMAFGVAGPRRQRATYVPTQWQICLKSKR